MTDVTLSKMDRLLIYFLMVTTIFGAAMGGSTIYRDRKKRALRVIHLQNQIEEKARFDSHLSFMKRTLSKKKEALEALNERIPAEGSIGDVLNLLSDHAAKENVELIHVRPHPPVQMKQFIRVSITLTARGEFIPLLKMIYRIESMNRLVIVEQLSLKKSGEDSPLILDVTINLYEKKR